MAMEKLIFNPWWNLEEWKLIAPESHILQIIEIFGEIPKDLQEREKFAERYFDDAGEWNFKFVANKDASTVLVMPQEI